MRTQARNLFKTLVGGLAFIVVFTSPSPLVTDHVGRLTKHWVGRWPLALECAYAGVPWVINYQGRLTDSGGKAIQGSVTLTFRLYDASTSGTTLWTEAHSVSLAEADSGIFNVILGSVTVLTSIDFNKEMWLSVQVGGDTEMTPRQRLTATGYAMNTDKMDGLDSTSFVRADADTSSSGKLTLTRAGTALVITPSSAPAANTKLIDVQNAAGTSKFSVDLEGDVAVAGDLAVTGTMSGSTSITGTTNASWTTGSATDATSTDVSLLFGQSTGQESLVFDGDSSDDFLLSDDLQLLAQSDLRFADSDSSNYVALQAPATVASNLVWTLPSADGSANQVLTTNASGTLSWQTTTDISGTGDITSVTAGTGLTGGGDSGAVTLTLSTPVSVANGGTGLASGTSGGILGYTATGTLASSSALTANALVLGGGAGATPSALGSLGTSTTVLHGNASGAPSFSAVSLTADVSGVLPEANGGTNQSTYTLGDTLYASAANTLSKLSGNTTATKKFLTQTGTGSASAAPAWGTIAASDVGGGTLSGDVILDTTGATDLAASGGSPSLDNRGSTEALMIATDPTANNSDGVIKLGRDDDGGTAQWEYIWYDNSARSDKGEFVFSASTRTETSSPAYISFSTGASTNRYALKFDPDVTPKTLSFVEIVNPGASQIENTLFETSAGGRMAMEFINAVRNGSFEAFSGFEKFRDVGFAGMGGFQHTASVPVEGGWDNFAPDEWVWVSGKVYQHSPKMLVGSATMDLTTDAYHGKSAVALQDPNATAAYSIDATSKLAINLTNDGAIKQVIRELKPDTWYAIGVKVALQDAAIAETKARVEVDGEDVTAAGGGGLKPVGVATAAGLSTDNLAAGTDKTKFNDLIGVFKTKPNSSEVTIYLICQQTGTITLPSTATMPDVCRFDAIQVVRGKSVPEFSPSALVDSGDQTVYGLLRVGRTTDSAGGAGGGILAVDRYVRTRGVEFFGDDPGFTGQAGGMGMIGPPNPPVYNPGATPGSLSLATSGIYTGAMPRDYKVIITTNSTGPGPDTYTWSYRDIPMVTTGTLPGFTTGGSASVSLNTDIPLNNGVNIKFTGTNAFDGALNDEWSLYATGMSMFESYNSFNPAMAYTPGDARIYKDPMTNKLMFKDGNTIASLSDIVGTGMTPSRVDPPMFFPATTGGGTMFLNISQGYTGNAPITLEVEICADGSGTTPDSFRVRNNLVDGAGLASDWDLACTQIPSGGGPYVPLDSNPAVAGFQGTLPNYGFTLMFGSPLGNYQDGKLNDKWQVNAFPGSGSSPIKILSGTSPVSISGTGDSRTVGLITSCAGGEVLKWNAGTSSWVCAPDANSGGSGSVTSVTAGTGLTASPANPITTSGTLAVDVGTTASKIVQLDSAGALPVVSGANLTSLNASNIASGTLALARLVDNDTTAGIPLLSGGAGAGVPAYGALNLAGGASIVTGELPDANVSNTLTASLFVGSGSTTTAVDLATAEVGGTLADANVADDLTLASTKNATISGPATTGDVVGVTGSSLTSGALYKGVVPATGFSGSLLKITDNAGTPATKFAIDSAGAITTGTLPWTSVTSTPVNLDTDSTNDTTGVTAGSGLTGGGASGAVTLNVGAGTGIVVAADSVAVDVGTTASKIVQLDGAAALPAVSGVNLTSLNASNLASGTVADARLSANVSLFGAAVDSGEITDGTVAVGDLGAGSVTLAKLNALRPHEQTVPDATVRVEAGVATISGTKVSFTAGNSPALPVVTANSRIDLLTIDSTGTLARVAGTQAVSPTAPAYPTDKLVLAEVTVNETVTVVINDADVADVRPFLNLVQDTNAGGTVTSITAGTGLTGGTITSSGTIAVDVGTTASKIVQLNASAELPAVSGKNLTTLDASQLASGTVADARLSTNVPLKNATNTLTATTASPILIKPSSAPVADTKLLDMQATGVGTTNFSVDAEGDVIANSLDLAVALPDVEVSDTLTASLFVGSGSTTTAVDLATAEVAGTLADANVSDTLTASLFVGSGSTTTAIDLATAEVAGVLPNANVADDITASNYLPLAGGTMTGNLSFSDAQKIIGGTATTADFTLQTTSGVGAAGADMHFLVGNNGATEALTILNSGYVGIGTTAPAAKLDVRGDVVTPTGGYLSPYGGIGRYQNLLTYAEDFTNAAWSLSSGSVTTTNNTAPNGTVTADTIPAGAAASDNIAQTSGTGADTTTFTGSVWLKVSSGSPSVTLSLASTGTAASTDADVTAAVTTTWQRFSVTKTFGAGTGSAKFIIKHGTSAVIAWGAQLESGVSAPGVYVRTTASTQNGSQGVISDGSPASTASVNSFETLAVSGQSNVVADASTDTLTLAAGTNITITTNASTDTVTIAGVQGVASGVEIGTTSDSFTLDTDSSGVVDVDLFHYFEDDGNATAHSLAWDDGLDTFLFNDDLLLQRAGDVGLTIDANTDTVTANAAYLKIQKGGVTDTTLFTVDAEGDVIANSLDLAVALPDVEVSDTLTASLFVGSGSTTTAVDLATAEVAGVLPDANVSDTLTASLFVGSGSTTTAVDLATAEVAGVLADARLSANVSLFGAAVDSGEITDGTVAVGDLGAGSVTLAKLNALRPHEQTVPDATVRVEAGVATISGTKVSLAASNSPALPVVTANSRIDLLTIDSTGTLARVAGTQAVSPTAPAYPTDKLVLAEVTVNETVTVVINDADIADVRPFLNLVQDTNAGGTVTSIIAGTGLTGGTITSSGTIAVDVGTTASKIVQLDGAAALPAVSGVNLTSLNATNLASGTVADARLSTNIPLKNATNTLTATTASPILIKPSSAPVADTKLLDMQATGVGTTNFSVDAEGDVIANSLDLAVALPDVEVSDTLTASLFVGSGSTTTAVDLATAEVAGTLADANVSDTLTASLFVGSGSTTTAIDLATAEVAGVLPNANVADDITASNYLLLAGGTMTGNIVIPDAGTIGQAAGPVLTFDDTANELEISGAELGIGTTSPDATLSIKGTGTFKISDSAMPANTSNFLNNFDNWLGVLIKKVGAGTGDYLAIQDSAGVSQFIVKSAGNVGIGTASPAAKLDVRGDLLTPTGSYLSPYGGIGRYENLAVQSEAFGTSWTLTSLSATDGSSSPNGATSADSLANTAAASGTAEQTVTITAAAAADYTFSVWLKAGTSTSATLALTLNGTSPTNGASGTLTLTSSWQRFSVKATTAADTTSLIAKLTNGSAVSGQTILAWGAQLEKISSPGVYVRSTTAAVAAGRGAVTDGSPTGSGSGTVTSITAGTGLTGGTITTSGTIAADVGTAANKIVQLDGAAALPAVSGVNLTSLNATNLASGTVADARLSTNIPLLTAANTFTATTASPILIKPSSAPVADTKLLDMQATGVGTTNFSVDAEGDVIANSLDLAVALADAEVSDTLTASLFVGSGSTTTAVDLATAEVAGTLADANVADDLTLASTKNASITGSLSAAGQQLNQVLTVSQATGDAIAHKIALTDNKTGGSSYGLYVDTTAGTSASSKYALYNTFNGAIGYTGYGVYNAFASTNSTAYGVYNSMPYVSSDGRNFYGVYNTATGSADGQSATRVGVTNSLTVGGGSTAYGVQNTLSALGGSTPRANAVVYGLYNTLAMDASVASVTGRKLYGVSTNLKPMQASDIAYGEYVSSNAASAAGTIYGLYADLTAGTATKYPAILLGGNVGIGTTVPQTQLEVAGDFASPYGGIGRYENLAVQSEAFGTSWTLTGLSATDGSSSPNGATSADSLANTAAASGTAEQTLTITAAAAADYTFSVWLKAGTSTSATLALTLNGTSPTNGASGTLTLTSSWQRFSVKATTAANTTSLIAKITNGSAVSGQTILAWGAQLEKISSPGVYVRSTTAAVAAGRGAVTDGSPTGSGSGTVTSITAGTGLTGGTITTSGTIAADVGTAANKIVQLDGAAALPAVSGVNLTSLNATNLASGTVADARLSTNIPLLTAANTFTATTASPILLKPSSAPVASTKLLDLQATGAGTTTFSVDYEGDVIANSLDLAVALPDTEVDNTLTLTGGTINGVIIGGTTAAAATFGGTTNTVAIASTGAMTYAGTAQPKRTIVLTSGGAIVPASNAPQQLQTNGTNISYYTLNYSGTAPAESAYWEFIVPDAYTGTTVNATLYWLTPSVTTTNAVKWFVDMSGLGDGQTLDAALNTAGTVTDNPTAVADQVLVTSEIASITTGWTAGEYAVVRVQRNAADVADTEGALAKLLMIKLEWTASAESD